MLALGEELLPTSSVHVYMCVLLHMHGVPGTLLGASTPNHKEYSYTAFPAPSLNHQDKKTTT